MAFHWIVVKISCNFCFLSSNCVFHFSKSASATSKSLNSLEIVVLKFLGNIQSISAFAVSYSVHHIADITIESERLSTISPISCISDSSASIWFSPFKYSCNAIVFASVSHSLTSHSCKFNSNTFKFSSFTVLSNSDILSYNSC